MKLLFFLRRNIGGGHERVLINIANKFAEKQYEIVLVIAHKKGTYNNEHVISDKVKVICLDASCKFTSERGEKTKVSFFERVFEGLFDVVPKLRKKIRSEEPDAIITFSPVDITITIMAALLLKIPIIISQRNAPESKTTSKFDDFITRFIFKFIYPRADGCVFQTEKAQAFFSEKLKYRTTVINNLVDARFFNVIRTQERENIIGTGRLHSQKNWYLAVKAFSLIADKIADKFVIYGIGDELNALNKFAGELNVADRVIFAGTSSEIENIVVNSKLYVLSSDYEGTPNALIEALIMGVPCVTTRFDGGGAEALIESGVNGIIVPKGDAGALSQAMLKMLTDTEYAEQLAAKARSRARKDFNPKKIFEQWERYILSVLSNQKEDIL